MREAGCYFRVQFTKNIAALLHGILHEPCCLGVEAQARVDGAHRIHQRCLDLRLVGEFLVYTLDTFVQDLPRRDRVTERFARVRDFEQADHELCSLARRFRFRFRDLPLLLRLDTGQIGRHCEAGRDRHADKGGGG